MATRTKDTAPAREKRGTSPSNSPLNGTAPQRRSRPRPSKTSSPVKLRTSPVFQEEAHLTGPHRLLALKKHGYHQILLFDLPRFRAKLKKQDTRSGTALVKEQVTSPSEIMEASDVYVIPQPETKQEDEESAIAKAEEEAPQVESNNEMGNEILVLKETEKIKEEKSEDVKVETEAVDTISDQDDASPAIKTEEPESESHIEETGIKHRELEEQTSNQSDNNQTEESVSDIPIAEVEENDEEQGEKDGGHGEYLDNKEVAASGNEATESKETEVQEITVEEKQETESVAVKKQVQQGKKDSAVSNDVIEETASKLREQRKNKVKALAGAFETVISLQEPK